MFVGVSTALTAVRRVFHPFIREGLKLYYRFSDTTPDFLLDGSTSFDGTDDYIDLDAHIADFSSQSTGTISFWFKTASSGYQAFISASDKGDGSSNYTVLMNAGDITLNIRDNTVYAIDATNTTNYNDNEWHHLAWTVDGSGNKMYIDGSQITLTYSAGSASTQAYFSSITDLDALTIGGNKDTGGGSVRLESLFNGSMANVGLWDRALSASEIESIYWRGAYSELKNTELTNLVSWYDLSSIGVSPTELISNGTMETASSLGGYENFPNNWTASAGSPSIHERSSTQAFAGTYSLRYGSSGDTFNAVAQDATVTGGVAYRLEFYIYGVTGSTMKFSHFDSSANPSTLENGDALLRYAESVTIGEWKKFTYDLTTYGSGTISGYGLQIGSDVSGTEFYIDNVSLKRINGATDSQGSNTGTIEGATVNTDSYSGESPFKPRIQDKANPKMAVQLSEGSTSFGNDDKIDLGTATFNIGKDGYSYSIGAWFKAPDQDDNSGIFSSQTSSSNEFQILLLATGRVQTHVYDGSTQGTVTTGTDDEYNDNQWHHVVSVLDSSADTLSLYVDGSLIGSATWDEYTTGSLVAQIGARFTSSNYFNGSIANVAIHSSALTQLQVQELMFTEKYSGLSADLKTNLVSWYDLGETVENGAFIADEVNPSYTLGTELVTNGTFTGSSSGWTLESGWSYASDQMVVTNGAVNNVVVRNITTVVGKIYRLAFTCTGYTNGSMGCYTNAVSDRGIILEGTGISGLVFTATSTSTAVGVITRTVGSNYTIDDISCKEITSNGNIGAIRSTTTTTGYTSSPHGVVDPLNFGELYSGRALDFDGSNDYVNIPDNNSLSFGDGSNDSAFSVSAWVNMDDATDFPIVTKGTLWNTNTEYHIITTSADKLRLMLLDNSISVCSEYADTSSALTSYQGQWIHVCCTYNGVGGASANAGITIYINGISQSLTRDHNAGNGAYVAMENLGADVHIGRNNTQYGNGKISTVKMFSAELTQAQVQELYTKPETVLPTGVSASNLKLDLPMQEGANSYVYDGSGNQNHGTIYGATWATGQEYGYQSSLVRSNTPMHFDGTNDLVAISNPLSSNWTFSIWARADFTDSGWHELYDKNPSSGGRITIAIVSNKFQMYDTAYRDSGYTLSDKNWHHYVITQTGTALNFYVDGSHQATVTGNGNSLGGDAHIGRYYPLAIEYWSGIINEVALYDTALDADAVTALYNSGVPLLPTSDSGNYDNSDNLTGYWRNDGITTWTDRTPLGTYGSELVTNGGFDSNTTSWSAVDGSLASVSGGQSGNCLELTRTGASNQYAKQTNVTLVVGNTYEFSFYVKSGTSGNEAFSCYCYDGSTVHSVAGTSTSSWVKHTKVFVMGGGDSVLNEITLSKATATAGTMLFDSVSVKKYRGGNDGTPGSATQSIVIPEGSTSGRDNQGYYLSDTTSVSNGIRLHGSEYINIQDSEVLSFGDGTDDRPFSVEAWVKIKDASSFMILTKGQYNISAEYNFYTDGSNKLNLTIYDESLSATYRGKKSNTALSSGQWIHVVATYDGTGGTNAHNGINLYINGSVVGNADVNGGSYVAMENLGADLIIGKDGSAYSKGLIDQARIYSKELSASEVLKNYNNGKSAHQ